MLSVVAIVLLSPSDLWVSKKAVVAAAAVATAVAVVLRLSTRKYSLLTSHRWFSMYRRQTRNKFPQFFLYFSSPSFSFPFLPSFPSPLFFNITTILSLVNVAKSKKKKFLFHFHRSSYFFFLPVHRFSPSLLCSLKLNYCLKNNLKKKKKKSKANNKEKKADTFCWPFVFILSVSSVLLSILISNLNQTIQISNQKEKKPI